MSQARIEVANIAGSAPSRRKKGLTKGVSRAPILGASRSIPAMGMHMGAIASSPLSISLPSPVGEPRHRSMAANTIKATIMLTTI